jgi:hypothetical protein
MIGPRCARHRRAADHPYTITVSMRRRGRPCAAFVSATPSDIRQIAQFLALGMQPGWSCRLLREFLAAISATPWT